MMVKDKSPEIKAVIRNMMVVNTTALPYLPVITKRGMTIYMSEYAISICGTK
ncbi:hypothetical protein ADIARSV_0859 [Arcticibacter svalbardensis MN12-7]|uniref:Uncharacterized protein n=1 Tax=Arcticibacter svalbardensis MN12-7 TaxID=1150600 RepID=R9H455_9SPHI|nr:hypothetical protein ADIARSV_0859 [Arcticibacter svalbardensis MN12-7]